MNRKLLFATGLCLQAFLLPAQKVGFCTSVSDSGEPVDAKTSWILKNGMAVQFLYQDAAALKTSKILFLIDKKSDDGSYAVFDTQSAQPEKTKSWTSVEYHFKQSGEYKISVSDARGKTLAEGNCTVEVQQASASASGMDYYAGARVRFCGQLTTEGKPDLYLSSFTVNSGSPIYICVDHVQPFKTSALTIEIYSGPGFKDKIVSQKITVKSSDLFASLPYTFPKAGEYKVSVYSSDDVFISSGTVHIRFQ